MSAEPGSPHTPATPRNSFLKRMQMKFNQDHIDGLESPHTPATPHTPFSFLGIKRPQMNINQDAIDGDESLHRVSLWTSRTDDDLVEESMDFWSGESIPLPREQSMTTRLELLGVSGGHRKPPPVVFHRESYASSIQESTEESSQDSRQAALIETTSTLTMPRAAVPPGAVLIYPLIVHDGSHQRSRPDWQAWLVPDGGEKASGKSGRHTTGVLIRHATASDLPELVKLGMPSHLGEPPSRETALQQWLATHPQGQYVVASATGELLGAMYTRRVASYENVLQTLLTAATSEGSDLHTPTGPVLQLLGVFQLPGASVGR